MLGKVLCFIGFHFREWAYEQEGSCEQNFFCVHCGAEKDSHILHEMTEWQYLRDDACEQSRYCIRCHEVDHTKILHRWNITENSEAQHKKMCGRCDQSEFENHDLLSGGYMWPDEGSGHPYGNNERYYICRVCEYDSRGFAR